jgi:acetyl esterase
LKGENMPINPKAKNLLDNMLKMGMKSPSSMSVKEARQMILNTIGEAPPSKPLASVSDRMIPGPAGDLPVRIYTPHGTGPFPLLVFFHGGGFVLCDLNTHDQMCRNLCDGADCLVVSVEYRLAPENKFPSATDDALAAARWAANYATDIGADPKRIAIGGDSAGGNLSAVTTLRIRDEGGPSLCGQLLIYPATEYYNPGTPSLRENSGYFLTIEDMIWFTEHYLNSESEAGHPHAFPMRAPDLSNLPPALVITAEYDPLRDEGELYANRLKSAGVSTTLVRYDGMIHGFFNFANILEEAREAMDYACSWLKDIYSSNRIMLL